MFLPLKERWIIHLNLRTITTLHVGAGRGEKELGEADLIIAKLPNNKPYIPGSSLKGFLRVETERLLSSLKLNMKVCVGPNYTCNASNPCPSCAIFGSPNFASRLIVRDLMPAKDITPFMQTRVAMNRKTRTVIERRTYTVELIPPNVIFEGEIVFENPEHWMLGLIFTLLEDVAKTSSIGGFASRGSGKIEFKIIKIEIYTPDSLIQGKAKITYEGVALTKFISDLKKKFREYIEQLKSARA